MAHDIFISFSNKDKPIADGICANLESVGIRCWIAPRDIAPGEDWPTAIAKAITKSRVMVLVFSSNSNSSEDVGRELILAANSKLVIIPFKIENIEPEPGKQYYLARTHWLDAINPLTQEQIEVLVKTVKSFLPTVADEERVKPAIRPNISRPVAGNRPAWIRYLWIPGTLAIILCILGVIASSMLWKQYTARSVQTALPTDTLVATTTPPAGILFADDFNDSVFDGNINTSLWGYSPYYRFLTEIQQENGALVFKRSTTDGEEDGQVQTINSWAFGEIGYVEARLKVDGQHTGTDGNLNMALVQAPDGSEWYTTCAIGMSSPEPYMWCIEVTNGDSFDYQQSFKALEYDKWYTFRIQMDPQTAELAFYLDDQIQGRWQPTGINRLRNAKFIMVMGVSAGEGTGMTGFIDDVKIGK